jgi:hypothetical protein
MAKCVVICGHAAHLTSNIGDGDYIDNNQSTLKEYLLDNSEVLFPVNLTIRETPILSNYYGTVFRKPEFKLPSIAKSWIQDSILLSTHMSCLMLFIYFRFLEFLISVGTSNPQIISLFDESSSFENIVLDTTKNINISENIVDQTIQMNNGIIRKVNKINNLYLLAYKYLTSNNSVVEGELLDDGSRIDLCIMVMCKILDFLYRSLKLTSTCFKEMKNMSSTSASESLFTNIQESGQVYEITSIDMFEQYLVDIVVAMNLRIQSVVPIIFSRLEESHESNMLVIGPEFLFTMALIVNNKITIQEAVQTRSNFYNLTRNMLYVFYKTYVDLFPVEDPQLDAPSNCTDQLSTSYSNREYFGTGDRGDNNDCMVGGSDKRKRKIEKLKENCEFNKPKNSMYNYIPSIDDYMLYYKKLSNQIGSDISKFDLEKFQACPTFSNLPFEFNVVNVSNQKIWENNDDPDEKSIKSYFELISTLDSINNNLEIFNNSLFKIGHLLSAILETMSDNYYFYLLENVALQHFYKRPVFYLFNDNDNVELGSVMLKLDYLNHIGFDQGEPYIDVEKLIEEIKTKDIVINFFNQKKYLHTLRLFILKRFTSLSDNKYFFIFKPIYLSKICPNFYLGILVVYLWHCIYNRDQIVSDKMI